MTSPKKSRPRLDPQQVTLALFLAHTYLEYHLPAKANALLHALQVSGAATGNVYVLRAIALVRMEKPEQALALLDEAALKGELAPGYHLVRAQALAVSGRHGEATEAFRCFMDSPESAYAPETPGQGILRDRRISQD
ncbi:hypothetical protein LV28_25460 [Pandoraea pnomenusa]|uniref:Zn-dependent protease, contains TPR repeats n=1 Tax=Pandoraea pnomenusa TaxID=93220 RepID=A0A378YW10_9BURK|nr:hypothetical protein [Pandoraea pnomenusa]ALR36069.1 hypothetical protein LV28_25460 [Pandoraea pnomenusa]MBN9096169.1 hypothetical protein [Pandoraea pnomenusa]SUA80631.1 Uncharacterised protein [Pandoraea pnomenusa]